MFLKKFNKKRYFQEMIEDMKKAIAELELKRFTLVNSHEQYRQQLDKATLALENMKAGKASEADLKSAQEVIDKSKGMMDALQREIAGAPVSDDFPEGIEGVDNQLKRWSDRMHIAQEFIRMNC